MRTHLHACAWPHRQWHCQLQTADDRAPCVRQPPVMVWHGRRRPVSQQPQQEEEQQLARVSWLPVHAHAGGLAWPDLRA